MNHTTVTIARFFVTKTGAVVIGGIALVGVGLVSDGAAAFIGVLGLVLVLLGMLGRIDALRLHADRGQERLSELRARVEEERENLRGLEERFNARYSPVHERDLEPSTARELLDYWNPRLGTDAEVGASLSALHRIRQYEAMAIGRLAATEADILIRCLVAQATKRDKVELCEIGTLFGLGALVVQDDLSVRSRIARLTVIDPLSGYYGEDRLDPPTQLPVTRANLERNAALFGVAESDLRIIEGLSSDDDVLAQVSDREYDVMILDGDHSYEGIRQDHQRYAGQVGSGGFLVIDDYDSGRWPDVSRYTDEVIARDERFQFVGASSRTAVFRRR